MPCSRHTDSQRRPKAEQQQSFSPWLCEWRVRSDGYHQYVWSSRPFQVVRSELGGGRVADIIHIVKLVMRRMEEGGGGG